MGAGVLHEMRWHELLQLGRRAALMQAHALHDLIVVMDLKRRREIEENLVFVLHTPSAQGDGKTMGSAFLRRTVATLQRRGCRTRARHCPGHGAPRPSRSQPPSPCAC